MAHSVHNDTNTLLLVARATSKSRITRQQKAIVDALAGSLSCPTGTVTISQDQLARKAQMSEATLKRHLPSAEADGWVLINHGKFKPKQRTKETNRYQLGPKVFKAECDQDWVLREQAASLSDSYEDLSKAQNEPVIYTKYIDSKESRDMNKEDIGLSKAQNEPKTDEPYGFPKKTEPDHEALRAQLEAEGIVGPLAQVIDMELSPAAISAREKIKARKAEKPQPPRRTVLAPVEDPALAAFLERQMEKKAA